MSFRIVQSKQNGRLKELRRVLEQPGKTLSPAGKILVGLEGPNLLAEALRAGVRLAAVFAATGTEEQVERMLDGQPVAEWPELLSVERTLLRSALTTEAPQAVAAVAEAPAWGWTDLLSRPNPLIVVLAGLQDPGNVGTIVRSAEAFGAAGVVALPGTVSVWNPKSVRASAGSVLRVPVVTAGVDEAFEQLGAAGVSVWTTDVNGAEPAGNLNGPVAVIIGNEGNGVSQTVAARASRAITIPCPGPVESLNAAIATSILLYEASQQRGGRR